MKHVHRRIVQSILDNDLYKFTMMMAVMFLYGHIFVEYLFLNRGQTKFPKGFGQALKDQVQKMTDLKLTTKEYRWLKTSPSLEFLKAPFLDFLRGYRFDPSEVIIKQAKDGSLEVKIRGPWYRTILWEVPLLAIISELYYEMTGQKVNDKIFQTNLTRKIANFKQNGCRVAEFGTRRRRSFKIQDQVVAKMKASMGNLFLGCSNVYLAMKHGVRPIGTHAHEWFMAHQAMFGTRLANRSGLEAWLKTFDGSLGIALPDTFTTAAFLEDFNLLFAKQFDGLRQDSGDPDEFAVQVKAHYEKLKINPQTKACIFSDGLDDIKAIQLQHIWSPIFQVAFGIGTFLTNDCGLTPLNIVIKLVKVLINNRWIDVVKLSDSPGKNTGTKEAIAHTKYELGLT